MQRDSSQTKFLITAGIGLLTFGGLAMLKNKINGPKCNLKRDLTDKVIIVTGANTGLGKETARALALSNATVILACRDENKGQLAAKEIEAETKNKNIHVMKLDLCDLSSIAHFAKTFKSQFSKLNVLIHNAGIMPVERNTSVDGFESAFSVHHFGPVYLTYLLIDVLEAAKPSRVIFVNSGLYKRGKINWEDLQLEKNYNGDKAYQTSKLASNMFIRELNKRLEGKGIKVVSVRPGMVRTEIGRYVLEDFKKRVLLTD